MERAINHISDDTGRIALLVVKTTDNAAAILLANQTAITRYQYSNHLGSACLELDENAEILSFEEFHPFGSTSYSMHSNDSEVSLKRYKYNGKERDEENRLDFYGARYYANWLCRFISVDPLKDNYSFQNSFAYAANNPITLTDVNGEGPGGGEDENEEKGPAIIKVTELENGKKFIEISSTLVVDDSTSQEDINAMQSGLDNFLNKEFNFSIKDGDVTTDYIIKLNINIEARENNKDIEPGEVSVNFIKGRSHATGSDVGADFENLDIENDSVDIILGVGNVIDINPSNFRIFSGKYDPSTLSHEFLHNLGTTDRYANVKDAKTGRVISADVDEGFDFDIMGGGTQLKKVEQLKGLVEYIMKESKAKGGSFLLKNNTLITNYNVSNVKNKSIGKPPKKFILNPNEKSPWE